MLKKLLKNITASVMAAVLVISAAACAGKSGDAKKPAKGNIELWSQSSVYKIMRNEQYDANFKKPLGYEVKAAKGEYHSAQILLTPDYDVQSYTISVNDLKTSDGETLKKENFELYNQKYIEVTTSTSRKDSSTGPGVYPDALLPFDAAVSHKENQISANNNQGIWITVFVPYEQKEGEYNGNFVLSVDGTDYLVPAKVTVWDYQISKVTHSKSVYQAQNFYLVMGELGLDKDMLQNYDAAAAKYRVSPLSMTLKAGQTLEDRVRYFTNPANPELTSTMATILLSVPQSGTGINRSTFFDLIRRLAVISAEDGVDYIDRAAVRPGYIDEPHLGGAAKMQLANSVVKDFNEAREVIAQEIEASLSTDPNSPYKSKVEGFDSQTIADSARRVNCYVTTHYDEQGRLDDVTNYCVAVSYLGTAVAREKYQQSGEEHWIYTANYGTPGYQIDANVFESRVMGWFMYDYGFTGELYWQTTLYGDLDWDPSAKANLRIPIDPYTTPDRVGTDNGDGYLFYPGKQYGLNQPVPSIRLMAMRDGREEYEYLYELDRLYSQAGYSADSVLKKIFSLVYRDMTVYEGSYVEAAREAIVELILLAQKGVFLTQYNQVGSIASMVIEKNADSNVGGFSLNGNAAKGKVVSADISLSDSLKLTTDKGLSFTLALGGKTSIINSFDSLDAVEEKSQAALDNTADGGKALKFTFADITKPALNIAVSSENVNKNIFALGLNVYNPAGADELVFVKIYLTGSGGSTLLQDFKLESGWNNLNVTGMERAKWNVIRNLTKVRIELQTGDGYSVPTHLLIDDLTVVK